MCTWHEPRHHRPPCDIQTRRHEVLELLHTDLPTHDEMARLLSQRGMCVSIYVPTTPISTQSDAARIELKNQVAAALDQLRASGASASDVDAIGDSFDGLLEDGYFWSVQANTLALFATPLETRTYRLPNELLGSRHVGDRFHIKPLLRATTFPHAAFVLALAQGSVRLIEISPDLPAHTVAVADMPTDAASSVGRASITDRSPRGRIQGSEGQKVRLAQYARQIDAAVRPVLSGLGLPLIIAGAEPLASIFRGICSYPHVLDARIEGNREEDSDAALAAAARPLLDATYEQELSDLRDLLAARRSAGRATTDIVDAARAATFGAVDVLLVDIDRVVPGEIDETTGVVRFAESEDVAHHGILDEIARRTYLSGGRVLAVRAADIPEGAPLAAVLRYAI